MTASGEIAASSLFTKCHEPSAFTRNAAKLSNEEMNADNRLRGGDPIVEPFLTLL